MKRVVFLMLLFVQLALLQAQENKKRASVSFTTPLDMRNATKDGVYLNGYVVNIPYDTLVKLHGKKVRISGKYIMVNAVSNDTSTVIKQGQNVKTKHIIKPVITVL